MENGCHNAFGEEEEEEKKTQKKKLRKQRKLKKKQHTDKCGHLPNDVNIDLTRMITLNHFK